MLAGITEYLEPGQVMKTPTMSYVARIRELHIIQRIDSVQMLVTMDQ